MRKYNEYQKIDTTKAEKIFLLITEVCKRNEQTTKEYENNSKIRLKQFLENCTIVDVFRQTNDIFRLCGRDEPFAEIEEVLNYEIAKSNEFLDSHEYCYDLIEMLERWSGSWRVDPYENFHERIDAIRRINLCLEYENIFTDGDLTVLDTLLIREV